MAEVKYGELASWDDGDLSGPNDFMNLVEGENKIRIVTNPYQFIVHWVQDTSGKNRKILCAIKNCPLCGTGVKAQTRWYVGVLDRKSGNPKILEISTQIYRDVRDYNSDPEWNKKITKSWGEIFAYDITITRRPKDSQPLYRVKSAPTMVDITEEETFLVEEFLDRVDIAKYTLPLTPEEVAEKAGIPIPLSSGNGRTSSTGRKGRVPKAGVRPTLDASEFDFGDDLE